MLTLGSPGRWPRFRLADRLLLGFVESLDYFLRLLSEQSNVCSARILLDEPGEGYASSSRLLDLDKCSWRELERSYGEFFLRLARAEDLAWDCDDFSSLEVL